MEEFYYDVHSFICERTTKKGGIFAHICENNPQRFVAYINGEYVLIIYHNCTAHGDHIQFKETLISSIFKYTKVKDPSFRRSVSVNDDLKRFRLNDIALRKYLDVFHAVYFSATTAYTIASRQPFMDVVVDHEKEWDSYNSAKAFLKERGLTYLENELNLLHTYNYIGQVEPANISRTLDHLVTTIKKQTR